MALEHALGALYAPIGRPSIPPEKLLRAMLLQALCNPLGTAADERLEYDLLFRLLKVAGGQGPHLRQALADRVAAVPRRARYPQADRGSLRSDQDSGWSGESPHYLPWPCTRRGRLRRPRWQYRRPLRGPAKVWPARSSPGKATTKAIHLLWPRLGHPRHRLGRLVSHFSISTIMLVQKSALPPPYMPAYADHDAENLI